MKLNFSFEIIEINFAFNDIDRNNFQSNQDSASRISAMGSGWNETNVSMALSNIFKIAFDGFKTSIFSGSTTIWLERNIVKLSNFLQPIPKLFDHCSVTFCLIFRNEWMDI